MHPCCIILGCRFKSTRRSLQKDIDELRNHGVQDIFVLCTRGELSKYRVPHLLEAYQSHRITVHHHPIPDGETPDITRCCLILNELRSCLKYNRKTLMHCYGGLGRSCLIAACLLLLRDFRASGAMQTVKQYNYLHDFKDALAAHLATEGTLARPISR
uniref:protein-tyrosine-phosphatase n=1 Tax=Varanus komodoensis TaxID=61221 RepID=A0A8D2IN32_VARKO